MEGPGNSDRPWDKGLRTRKDNRCNHVSGYKGSRLIIANMFLLLTLCSILPSVRALANEVPCHYSIVHKCAACIHSDTFCGQCKPAFANIGVGEEADCIPLHIAFFNKLGLDSNGKFSACTDPACTDCFFDNTKCPDGGSLPPCTKGQFKIDMDNKLITCETILPEGYGPERDQSKFIVPCLMDSCAGCSNNYIECYSCRTTMAALYLLDCRGGGKACCFRANTAETYGLGKGYHPKTATNIKGYESCLSPHCLSCGADYSRCSACKPYALNVNGFCLIDYMISADMVYSDGTKLDTAGTCDLANCQICSKEDGTNLKCFKCKNNLSGSSPIYYYPHPSTGQCVEPTNLHYGYGGVKGRGITAKCTDPNCASCSDNVDLCTLCKEKDASGKVLHLIIGLYTCTTLEAKDLVGFGKVKDSKDYSACTNDCLYCRDDHTVCQTPTFDTQSNCNSAISNCFVCLAADALSTKSYGCAKCGLSFTGARLYLDVLSNPQKCVDRLNLLEQSLGRMRDYNPDFVVRCKEPNCKDCIDDWTVCQTCKVGYTLEVGKCKYKVTGKQGINVDTGAIGTCLRSECESCITSLDKCDTKCVDPNCKNCNTADSTCEECILAGNTADQTYLYNGKCIKPSEFPDKMGAIPQELKIEACTDTKCVDCKADRSKCTVCENDIDGLPKPYVGGACTSVTDTNGYNQGTGQIASCSTANCLRCNLDTSVCTKCDNTAKYYLFNDGKGMIECQGTDATASTKIAPRFGINPTTFNVEACAPGCLECLMDSTNCNSCNNLSSWYLYDDGKGKKVCQSGSSTEAYFFNPGMGPDTLGDKMVKPCELGTCDRCEVKIQTCTKCKDPYYYKPATPSDMALGCFTIDNFPASYGINKENTAFKEIAICSVENCSECTDDSSSCSKCTGTLLADITAKACIDSVAYSGKKHYGYVGSSTSGQVGTCTDPNCDTCSDDNSKCKVCLSGYFLNLADSKCYQNPENGYGWVLTDGSSTPSAINSCKSTLCSKCSEDYTKCTECKVPYLLDSAIKTCFETAPPGYGLKAPGSGSYEIIACDPTKHCSTCAADYTVCDACELCNGCTERYHFDPTAKKCYLVSDIPDGMGIDTTNKNQDLATCDGSSTCLRCTNDKTKCSVCKNNLVLYVNGGTCSTADKVPANTGKVTLSSGQSLYSVADCSSKGCIDCVDDYLICKGCDTTGYFYDVAAQACRNKIDNGFGLTSAATNEIRACTDVNCLKCSVSNTKCTECKTGYFKDGDICVSKPDDGKGENISEPVKTVQSCSPPNCMKCAANYKECTECNADYFVYTDFQCYMNSGESKFPDKTGIVLNSSPKAIALCTDSQCISCLTDNSVCDQCDTGLYLDSAAKKCVAKIDPRFGLKIGGKPSEIVKCENADCISCEDNHLKCKKCDGTIFYDEVHMTCMATIADGMGKVVNDPINTIRACSVPSCGRCSDDYKICQKCNDMMFVDLINNKCHQEGKFPAGFGKDTANTVLTVKPCADTNCDLCTDNYQICTQCNDKSLLSPTPNKCYVNDQPMPERLGKQTKESGQTILIPCSDARCINCHENYQLCTLCDKGFSLDKEANCLKVSTKPPTPILPIPAFDKKPNSFTFAFPGKKLTKNILWYLIVSLVTSEGKIINDQSKFSLEPEKEGLTVSIDTDEDFGEANLVIDRIYTIDLPPTSRILAPALTEVEKATLNSMPFPFQGTVISNVKSSGVNAINSFEVYTKIGIALRIISNILLPFDYTSRAAAFGIDRAFSHLTLASIQGSEQYIISRMAVKLIKINRKTVIPFLEFDSLEDNRARPECNPTDAMLVSGIDCDFFVNYGDNAIGLTIILVAMIIIDLVYYIAYGKSTAPAPVGKSVGFFIYITLKTFGLRFFLAKMDGVMMESIFYSFINIYTVKAENIGGFILSLGFIFYYLIQIYLCFTVTKQLVSTFTQTKNTSTPSAAVDVVDFHESTNYTTPSAVWRISSMMWTGIRADLGSQAVYYPIVSMIRMFLLGLIVGLLTDLTVTLAFLVIIVETVFILYALATVRLCPRVSALDNILEFIGPVFNMTFYIFSVFSNLNSAKTKDNYDQFLFIVLTIFFLAYLLIVALSILKSIFNFVQWMRSGGQTKKRYEVAETVNTSPDQYLHTQPQDNAHDKQENDKPAVQIVNFKGIVRSTAIQVEKNYESPYNEQFDVQVVKQ